MAETLAELAGLKKCGHGLIYDPCTFADIQHNFRESIRLLTRLCDIDIPSPPEAEMPAGSAAVKLAVAKAKWQQTNPPTVLADDISGSPLGITIVLLRTWDGDPNVEAGDQIVYATTIGGTHYALSDYMDSKIGTVKFWARPIPTIPKRWVIMNGIDNASGSNLNMINAMLELGSTASDVVLSAEDTSQKEAENIIMTFDGQTDPAGSGVGVTDPAYANLFVPEVPAQATYPITPELKVSKETITIDDTTLSTSYDNPYPDDTLVNTPHTHIAFGAPVSGLGNNPPAPGCDPYPATENIVNDFHHVHSHGFPLGGVQHNHEIGPHRHGGKLIPDPHDHEIQIEEHHHYLPAHGHESVELTHVHTVLAEDHDHSLTHQHQITIPTHKHLSSKPKRLTMIPIERIY
jgi:hypothetical protein